MNVPPVIRRSTRRAAEEIIATSTSYEAFLMFSLYNSLLADIPTISMDEADGDDDEMDTKPQIAVAPE